MAVLDDEAFGAATDVVPKFVSPADPAARWTGAHGGQAFFAYSTNYLIDVDNGIIVDVEATTAIRQAEVLAAKRMIERSLDRFDLYDRCDRPDLETRADGRLLSVRPITDGDRHGMAGHRPADRARIRQANRRTSLSPLRGRRSPAPSGRGSAIWQTRLGGRIDVTLVSAQLKLDVTIPAEGGIELGAWLFLPEGDGIRPAVTMAHGFGGTREHGLERFAQAFAAAGFVMLVHDHRNFGMSGGDLRGDIDPWQQIADWRRAISYLRAARKLIRPVLVYGAPAMPADTLSCLAQQIGACAASLPRFQRSVVTSRACDGFHLTPRPPWSMPSTRTRERGSRGEPPRRQAVVSGDVSVAAAYRSQDAIDFYLRPIPEGIWKNEVTLRSIRAARMYEPGIWVSRVSPTPLLMVVARDDKLTGASALLLMSVR